MCDRFSLLKKKILMIICCRCNKDKSISSLNGTELIYYKGFKKIQTDISIEHIINTINKLKAGLGAIIESNTQLIEKTK